MMKLKEERHADREGDATRRQLLDDQLAADRSLRNGNCHHDDDQPAHQKGEQAIGQDKAIAASVAMSVAHTGGCPYR